MGAKPLALVGIFALCALSACQLWDDEPVAGPQTAASPKPHPLNASAPALEPSFAVLPRGGRLLGMDPGFDETGASLADAEGAARGAGAQVLELRLAWTDFEPTTAVDCATVGQFTDPGGRLAALATALPSTGLKLSLTLPVVDGPRLLAPPSLAPRIFRADPAGADLLACRFSKFLDWVADRLPSGAVISVQLGRDLAAYPASAASSTAVAFWAGYWRFFSALAPHAHARFPHAVVGVAADFYALLGSGPNPFAKDGLAALNGVADFVGASYLPWGTDGKIKDPIFALSELPPILVAYPAKPIRLVEIAYPTGTTQLGSSPARQAAFVTNIFKVWDLYPTRFPYVAFRRLDDLGSTAAGTVAARYGESGDPAFLELLSTLGLRAAGGAVKAGYTQLKLESSARGW